MPRELLEGVVVQRILAVAALWVWLQFHSVQGRWCDRFAMIRMLSGLKKCFKISGSFLTVSVRAGLAKRNNCCCGYVTLKV